MASAFSPRMAAPVRCSIVGDLTGYNAGGAASVPRSIRVTVSNPVRSIEPVQSYEKGLNSGRLFAAILGSPRRLRAWPERSLVPDRVDLPELLDFLRAYEGVLVTIRRDGSPQLSPVTYGVDGAGRILVSTYPERAKVHNLRRNPAASPWRSQPVRRPRGSRSTARRRCSTCLGAYPGSSASTRTGRKAREAMVTRASAWSGSRSRGGDRYGPLPPGSPERRMGFWFWFAAAVTAVVIALFVTFVARRLLGVPVGWARGSPSGSRTTCCSPDPQRRHGGCWARGLPSPATAGSTSRSWPRSCSSHWCGRSSSASPCSWSPRCSDPDRERA
ncbi:pyridoxamine 5'-phosphate oxidase family protein [Salana multivorans]